LSIIQQENPRRVKAASSAVSVVYSMALGLDLQNPHAPFRKDVLSYYIRKAAAGMSDSPALMEVTFDLGNVTRYLVQRGPLVDQSFADLIDSAVIILRAFWALRAADLFHMAQLYACDLDTFETGSDAPVTVWFYSMKTSQGRWTSLSFRPLSRSRLRKGLQLSATVAGNRARSCCAVLALAEIRRRMLPGLRLQTSWALKRKKCYSKNFFPFKKSSLMSGLPFQYIKAGTMNGLLSQHHGKMPGMPAFATGCHPRHYRHVSLSTMHFVGSADTAKVLSTHAKDSTIFQENYKIADHGPRFQSATSASSRAIQLCSVDSPGTPATVGSHRTESGSNSVKNEGQRCPV